MEPSSNPLQLAGAIFAALLGLAFGSFLNVVLTRLPEGESIATPRSHCRNCDHTLAWWENLPLLSWLILRGRCRQCHTPISPRYPLVELAIATLWTLLWLRFAWPIVGITGIPYLVANTWITLIGYALLTWLLVALAALDAEHFWLPDILTLPGIALGFALTFRILWSPIPVQTSLVRIARNSLYAILASAAIILIIRLAYWLIRRKEGMGLGDAKLMAMLGAWLGFRAALESFALAVFSATLTALIWIAIGSLRSRPSEDKAWAQMPLPLGTFLCLAALSEVFHPSWLYTWWNALWTALFLP
jgi:leader peptidase (prepilin peptidase) / N-methyltransferase